LSSNTIKTLKLGVPYGEIYTMKSEDYVYLVVFNAEKIYMLIVDFKVKYTKYTFEVKTNYIG